MLSEQVEIGRDQLERINLTKDLDKALYWQMRNALLKDILELSENVTSSTK